MSLVQCRTDPDPRLHRVVQDRAIAGSATRIGSSGPAAPRRSGRRRPNGYACAVQVTERATGEPRDFRPWRYRGGGRLEARSGRAGAGMPADHEPPRAEQCHAVDLARASGPLRSARGHPLCTLFVTGSDHPDWSAEQATAKSGLLSTGSAAVVPDTAYPTPFEAPEATMRLVRQLWGSIARDHEPGDTPKPLSGARWADRGAGSSPAILPGPPSLP